MDPFYPTNQIQNKPIFTHLQYKIFENTVGKGEIAFYEQFLLFPQRFQLFWRTFHHFPQVQNCRLQTLPVLKSLTFRVTMNAPTYELKKVNNKFLGSFRKIWGSKPSKFKETRGSWKTLNICSLRNG